MKTLSPFQRKVEQIVLWIMFPAVAVQYFRDCARRRKDQRKLTASAE